MEAISIQYGLFLAKTVTVVAALVTVIVLAARAFQRSAALEHLEVKKINDKYRSLRRTLEKAIFPKKTFSRLVKADEQRQKARRKGEASPRRRIFVFNFDGDIRASAVSALREEITAVLTLASLQDEVVVRLNNAGGLVHEHGLAASQLERIRSRGIPLTVVVDKVAASGGYMMACVAERILAAPFAVIGSIGVVAELPNFHRWLDQHGIDFEIIKAGELKRTLTVFGKNTEEDRGRMHEQIEDTHALFRDFVAEHRPQVDLARVATGQYWFATRALDLKLVDAISTSDDYLLNASENADLFELRYVTRKKPLVKRLVGAADGLIGTLGLRRPL